MGYAWARSGCRQPPHTEPDDAVSAAETVSGRAGAASVLACRAGVRGPWQGRRGRAAYIWRTGSPPVPTVRHTARCHACRRAARGPGAIVGTREVHLQCTRVYAESMTGIRPYETVSCSARRGARARSPQGSRHHPIQAGSRWDVKRTHARMNGCGKPRCCTGRPRRDAARVRRSAFPAVAGPARTPRRCSPGGEDGVARSRPSVRVCGSDARGYENRDRGSHFTAPPHYDPAPPSHVPHHSLKGMTACPAWLPRDGRWDVERSDLSMFAPTG